MTNFRVLEDSPIHTGKCVKQTQIFKKSLSIWIAMHCARQSRLRISFLSFFSLDLSFFLSFLGVQFLFENLFLTKKKLLPESRHFARENAFSKKEDSLVFCILWETPFQCSYPHKTLDWSKHLRILDWKCEKDFSIWKLFHTQFLLQKCPFTR